MHDKIIRALLISVFFFSTTAVYADELHGDGGAGFTRLESESARTDPDYYSIDPASIKITRLDATEENDISYLRAKRLDPGGIPVLIDQIINIGAKIWDIVKLNAPTADIETTYATALPQGITAWNQLAGWQRPKSYTYGFSVKNLYGATVVNVKYKVMFTYGGSYNGKGRYLTGVTMLPVSADVSWGYRFSLSAQVPDSTVVNMGTGSDPVAALQLNTVWKITTSLKDSNGAGAYYMQGDGYFEELSAAAD
ncbi:MAG: hypothetical protein WCW52_09100 [Elusimicrobiales bacterium]|jgi:hypothetical protein